MDARLFILLFPCRKNMTHQCNYLVSHSPISTSDLYIYVLEENLTNLKFKSQLYILLPCLFFSPRKDWRQLLDEVVKIDDELFSFKTIKWHINLDLQNIIFRKSWPYWYHVHGRSQAQGTAVLWNLLDTQFWRRKQMFHFQGIWHNWQT